MPTVKKIPRIIFPILLVPVVLAGVLGITASFRNSSTATSKPSASATATSDPSVTATSKPSVTPTAASAELETLLNKGKGHTDKGYFEATSSTLVAAAAGGYNSRFYGLGELLVKDGLSNTIIGLGREMNGKWYEWSEHRAPPSEPDAYIRAWRQIVTTMRSVPGQHFKFPMDRVPDRYVGSRILAWQCLR